MAISKIKITNPSSGSRATYPAKSVDDESYDYIQVLESELDEVEGFAILRYNPTEENVIVSCEFYEDDTELEMWKPLSIGVNCINVSDVDIFAKKHSDIDWIQVGKNIPIPLDNKISFIPLISDFSVGDFIDIKVVDVDQGIEGLVENVELKDMSGE